MKTIMIFIAAVMMTCFHANGQSYGKRFVNHIVFDIGTSLQYRKSERTIHTPTFFGGDVAITPQVWGDFERVLGINFPGIVDNQFVGLEIPLPQYVHNTVRGFEFQNQFTIGIPYLQARVQWASGGRLEKMSPFQQPSRLLKLAGGLLSEASDFVPEVTQMAIEHSIYQDAIVRGRVDLQLEANMRNLLAYKLNSKPLTLNSSGSFSMDINVYPYLVLRSFDASNRFGSAQGFGVDDVITQNIMDADIPSGFRDVLLGGSQLLTQMMDRTIFVPVGTPLYKGYGGRGVVDLYMGKAITLSMNVDYSRLSNNTRGVDPTTSLVYSAGLKIGLNRNRSCSPEPVRIADPSALTVPMVSAVVPE
jgi:hypothetical protein